MQSPLVGSAHWRFATRKSYYEVLNLPVNATEDEIRDAYHALAKIHHPDVNLSSMFIDPKLGDRFREISEAYHVLSQPESRRSYDLLHSPN